MKTADAPSTLKAPMPNRPPIPFSDFVNRVSKLTEAKPGPPTSKKIDLACAKDLLQKDEEIIAERINNFFMLEVLIKIINVFVSLLVVPQFILPGNLTLPVTYETRDFLTY